MHNRMVLAFTALLGTFASIAGFQMGKSLEYDVFQDTFHQQAINKVSSIGTDLAADYELLLNLRSFFESSEFVSREEFATYTRYALDRHKEIQALEWVPKVDSAQRPRWELMARQEGYPEFTITEKTPDGQLVSSAPRDEYYPVYYVEPLVGNEAALGFDLGSSPDRKAALDTARDNNTIVATAPIKLVQEKDGLSVLLFLPIYDGNPINVEQRRKKLRGFVLLVVSVKSIFETAVHYMPDELRRDMALYVDDVTNGEPVRLYEAWEQDVMSGEVFKRNLAVAGREWQITFSPTQRLIQQINTQQPFVIFFSGLLLTILVMIYLLKQSRVKAQIEKVVHSRTVELKESEAKALAIMDGVVNAIVVIDAKGRILKCNRAAENMFSYKEEELFGRNVNILMPEPYHSEHDGYIRSFIETGEKKIIGIGREVTARRKDGSLLPIYLGVTEIKTENEREFVGVMIDLSERQKLDKIKSEFVSTVSHELRTPLTAINGALRLVLGGALGELPEKMKEILEVAQRNTDRQLFMVNDLLDFQKLESGCMDFKYEVVNIGELLENSIVMNHAYAKEFGIKLAYDSVEKNAMVYVDPNRLAQVLSNFISNAVKFSPQDEEVTVRMIMKGGVVRVDVIDRGPGIPEDFRDRIFNRFAQADGSSTRKVSGTGLGLAISKMIVEEMKGSIGYESEEGKGSSFYFELDALSGPKNTEK